MKIRCDYCENTYEDTQPKCPYCGAPNPSHQNDKKPKTIEELKSWYKARKLPPEETTRFFIGTDYKEPKAFGIYRDENTGEFIVYKNKADGSRAVRYKGKDEAYAVNEIYQRLKDEIVSQKARQQRSSANSAGSERSTQRNAGSGLLKSTATIALFVFFIICLVVAFLPNKNGYYRYNDDTWYRHGSDWYYYDTYYNTWHDADDYEISVPSQLQGADKKSEYYEGSDWDSDLGVSDWDDSIYHVEYESSDDDWSSDSDWDWDSGSDWDWDSGSDWDSDW